MMGITLFDGWFGLFYRCFLYLGGIQWSNELVKIQELKREYKKKQMQGQERMSMWVQKRRQMRVRRTLEETKKK